MNKEKENGNVPMTIDSNGNVVPRRYGVSRWSSPKFYKCDHNSYDECSNAAKYYFRKQDILPVTHEINKSHNCCGQHDEKETK